MSKNLASIFVRLMLAAFVVGGSARAQQHIRGHFGQAGAGGVRYGDAHFRGPRIGETRLRRHYDGNEHLGHNRRGGWHYRGAGYAWGAVIGGLPAEAHFGTSYYNSLDYFVSPTDEAIVYCMRQFPSYDFWSHTYLGIDGYRHSCP
jgi:hypothetical protein